MTTVTLDSRGGIALRGALGNQKEGAMTGVDRT